MIWKKDNRLISAGDMIIRKDPRLRLEGYNLTMHGVGVKDEGEYICEVETYTLEPIQQSNILNVLIPASVQPLPHSGDINKTLSFDSIFKHVKVSYVFFKHFMIKSLKNQS